MEHRLADCMPEFSDELRSLALQSGRPEIAEQLVRMRIVDRCRCGDDFWATFYTGEKPQGGYGPNQETIELPAETGMILLDLVNGLVRCVEVLYRDDIRLRLQKPAALTRSCRPRLGEHGDVSQPR